MQALTEQISHLQVQFETDLSILVDKAKLHTKYLGKKGLFNQLAKELQNIPAAEKKAAGKALNEFKEELESQIATISKDVSVPDWVDLTQPGDKPQLASIHPISQAMAEITQIFERIGFTRVRYPEVDWDWYTFESLNMEPGHPARDEWETFFVDIPDTTQDVPYDPATPRLRHPDIIGGKVVLTPHTSNGQIREMERLGEPPIRMINIARCYRRQQDATHTQMFHQFEGLVIDKGINIQHLKGTLDYFAKEFYGSGAVSRIRPFHFRFTEPSFEVDFRIDQAVGSADSKLGKSGWLEVGGAGMVHPNVLRAGGIDPDEYTGFAFGWGVERTYTLKPGLSIDDIRLLYGTDVRFLEQF